MESVLNDLASRYCPVDKAIFVARLGSLVAVLAGLALVLFWFAKRKARNPRRTELAYIGVYAILAVAIGGAALVVTGLSGCGGTAEAGLTWDWPW